MSEGKTIIELLNELTNKNFDFTKHFVEVSIAGNTYKMSFETFFSGILAPDGAGSIDVGNNNLINVGNISGLSSDLSGNITASGNGFNLILPYIRCKYEQTEQTSFVCNYGTEPDVYNNFVFDIESDRFIVIPRGKTGQFTRVVVSGTITKTVQQSGTNHTVYFRAYLKKYNTITEVETDITSILLQEIPTINTEPVGTTYDISYTETVSGIINIKNILTETTDELRIYLQTDYTSGEFDTAAIFDLQAFR